MNDRIVHIIAPNADIARVYALKIGKFPYRITSRAALRQLSGVEVVILGGDSLGPFEWEDSGRMLCMEAEERARSRHIKLVHKWL